MPPADERKVLGCRVQAKALHVSNLSECARRYGSNKSTKMLLGTVVEVTNVVNPESGRTSTFITADYDLGGGTIKQTKLNIRSVKKAAPPPPVPAPPPAPPAAATNMPAVDLAPPRPAVPNETAPAIPPPVSSPPPAAPPSVPPAPPSPLLTPRASPERLPPPVVAPAAPAAPPNPSLPPAPPLPVGPVPVVVVHDQSWYIDDEAIKKPQNKRANNYKAWGVRDAVGNIHGPGSDKSRNVSRLDYFMMMFPPQQLSIMLQLTNSALMSGGRRPTSKAELLKYFGVMILCTRYEFTARASLWSTTAPSKYVSAASMGKTGMPRQRFDDLWRYMVWSEQPPDRSEGMSHEKYRWMLVDGFVEQYNRHRENDFIPSDLICVDESISRWYGQGGHWINHGLPMYVAIDRKPENGCEIQNACCGRCSIMMRLKLVKTAEEEATHQQEHQDGMLHGTKVLLFLIEPWLNSGRTTVGDSYFASVGAAYKLDERGMGFIGVVKTATKRFPMAYLSNLEMQQRGERNGVVTRGADSATTLMAFVWMDRDRRYFIASSSSLEAGLPHVRKRWRQVNTRANADAERVEVTVPQPKACETYYSACGKIDGHNRHRQATLMLENKLPTQEWSRRVNMTLFGMIVVDSWLAFSACTDAQETQKEFYTLLAEELIDNTYADEGFNARRRQPVRGAHGSPTLANGTGVPRGGVQSHITPTKKKRKLKGVVSSYLRQGRCTQCSTKTTSCCSDCVDAMEVCDNNAPRTAWICNTKDGKLCYATHMRKSHGV
jgi:hypothetical protein